MDGRVWEALHVAHALRRSGEFDLVHNNLDWLPLSFSALCAAPMVTTIHGFSNRAILPAYRAARSAYVSISDSDRVPELDYAATVYHGIDLAALPFSPDGGDDLVILGRIHPDKGTAEAIEIARLAGRRLVICGIVQDEEYFHERVQPHIDDDTVVYLGSVGPQQRADGARLGLRAAAPDRLRRAVRAVRRRVDGLRHTGCRLPPGLDAGDRRRRADRISGRRRAWRPRWRSRTSPTSIG